jgi:hypothetical protein
MCTTLETSLIKTIQQLTPAGAAADNGRSRIAAFGRA